MALTPKDREKIIEEETLRFETRQNLHAQACATHPRCGRWLWVLAVVALGWALWCHFMCGGASCMVGHRMPGMMEGKRCQMHGEMMGGVEDPTPAKEAPAKK